MSIPDEETKELRNINGWLVETIDDCTCGTGPDGYYGQHESGCGNYPLVRLDELDGWPTPRRPEQRPQVNTHTIVLLPIDDLPEDVAIGHLAEMSGLIPHDVARADTFRNALCRNHLRLAEAWAAGYQAGKRAAKGDPK